MGSTKVLLENNCVSIHEREAQGILEGCEPVIIDAAHLVDLRFDSSNTWILFPAKQVVGWYNVNEKRTRLRYQAPEIVTKQVCIPWASIQECQELSIEER